MPVTDGLKCNLDISYHKLAIYITNRLS